MLTPLSQRDKRWADKKLGNTLFAIGRYGCTLTCLSMATEYFKSIQIPPKKFDYLLPNMMAQKLSFTPEGYLLWESLAKAKMKLIERVRVRDDAKIKKALENPAQVCLLQVEGWHWVFAMGIKKPDPITIPSSKNEIIYKIIDPWFGDSASSTRYKTITGCATIGVV